MCFSTGLSLQIIVKFFELQPILSPFQTEMQCLAKPMINHLQTLQELQWPGHEQETAGNVHQLIMADRKSSKAVIHKPNTKQTQLCGIPTQ